MSDEKSKPESYWKSKLTPEQYAICREKGTEPAFSGEYYDHNADGSYACVACGEVLFDSSVKYDSGSGWPSFYQSSKKDNIERKSDISNLMIRTEALCNSCGAHLGHIFPDGPEPTGERFCVNSTALKFTQKKI